MGQSMNYVSKYDLLTKIHIINTRHMSSDRFKHQVHDLINKKVRLIKIDFFKVDYVLRSTIFFYLNLFI